MNDDLKERLTDLAFELKKHHRRYRSSFRNVIIFYIFIIIFVLIYTTIIGYKIQELAERGLAFAEVVEQVERYLDEMNTMFVLESLENLRKNGRLTKVQALVTGSLRIKLLMGSTPEGEIIRLGQGFTERQALHKMIGRAAESAGQEGKRLVISHCNCPDRASYVRDLAEKLCRFREILITATGGISTVYANDGGIVIAY